MGTRCLTFVYNERNDRLVGIYRQFDGYPGGHGKEIAEFLKDRKIINGIPSEKQMQKASNGMDCLAASLIASLKTDIGNIYIVPTNTGDCGQEYEYHIWENRVVVKNFDGNSLFFGDWEKFFEFCSSEEVA